MRRISLKSEAKNIWSSKYIFKYCDFLQYFLISYLVTQHNNTHKPLPSISFPTAPRRLYGRRISVAGAGTGCGPPPAECRHPAPPAAAAVSRRHPEREHPAAVFRILQTLQRQVQNIANITETKVLVGCSECGVHSDQLSPSPPSV